MFHETEARVAMDIQKGKCRAVTTDEWTSMSIQSYITSTCHYIDSSNFKLESRILDTKYTPDSHTAENLSNELDVLVAKWKLTDPVTVMDNARNIVNSCSLSGFPHIGCFAHVMNLAVNKALAIPEVNAITGKCRRIAAAFKQSSLKAPALKDEKNLLDLKIYISFSQILNLNSRSS